MTPDPPPQPVGLCGCGEPLFAEDDPYQCPDCIIIEEMRDFMSDVVGEEQP